MPRFRLEVPVQSWDEAVLAAQSGADRLELCSDLTRDGLTPDSETLEKFAHAPPKSPRGEPVPFVVMIRPRAGDFCYNDAEITAMESSIATARRAGALGVVFGALTPAYEIDIPACRRLIAAATRLETVFHRAFDAVTDSFAAPDPLIALNFSFTLTSPH